MAFLTDSAPNRFERAVVQCTIAIVTLLLITAGSERLHLNLATTGLLFVIVIVLVARLGNFLPSVAVSLSASLSLAYLAPPAHSLRVDDPLDLVAVLAFLITSLIIARLVSRLRRMSEEALSSVNRKLIDADERVRARIGKELHDDIEQRLALLSIEVAQLSAERANANDQVLHSLNGIREKPSTIAADLQALAYELRPYKLEYLGMAAVMQNFCKKFGEQHDLEIHFTSRDLPDALPDNASLSLIRVLGEALHNSAHTAGRRAWRLNSRELERQSILPFAIQGLALIPNQPCKAPDSV